MPKLRLSFGNRSLAFTPLGTRYTVVCLLLGIAAVNSGSNLLYLVVAMMLSMMLISGVLSEQALRKVSAARMVPDEIYAGSPFTVRYLLKNDKSRISSFALSVEECYPDGSRGPGAFVLKLAPGERAGIPAEVTVPRRGRWVATGVEIATRFPFGLFRKTRLIKREDSAIVYPRIRALPPDVVARLTGGLGEVSVPRKGQGTEVRSLREYQSFDEARLIHWKSSARLSTLMAKEFESSESAAVTVILDNLAPEVQNEAYARRFEEGVTLAASLIHHLMAGQGRPVGLLTRDSWIRAGSGHAHFIRLMETLARIGPAVMPADGLEGDTPAARAVGSGASVLVVIEPGYGWARLGGQAGMTLEARDEV